MRVWMLSALLAAAPAWAQEPHATRIWLTPGFLTHHFKHGDFREDNYGAGVEVVLAPQHALMAGSFINSDRERSRYAAYYWRPWRRQAGALELGAGIVVGLIDGYSSTHNGGWFPAAVPAVSAEYRFLGANLAFIPHPKNGAALALQLKLRVW
jgi:hypothetical protein